MKRRIILGPVAEEELAKAIRWYNGRKKGLGKALKVAVRETFQRIRSVPESRAIVRQPDIRRSLVFGYPYLNLLQIGRREHSSDFGVSHEPRSVELETGRR